jgi:uncharacterized protein (TIGR02186 family)
MICLAALALQTAGAGAVERLVATLAPSTISIASSFSGGTVVLFGAIELDGALRRDYDVVATVIGPRQTVVARKRERVAGVWINRTSRTFVGIPSFYGVFASRPFDAISDAETLQKQRIGFNYAVAVQQGIDPKDVFLENLVQIRTSEQLYNEQARAVTFLSPTAFRVEIPLPQNVLVGRYEVELALFSNDAVIAQTTSSFNVVKVGVEEFVVDASVDNSLLYGLATMMMALLTGWLASIAFRKD